MAMFKKVAGKAKLVTSKDAEKIIKANRATRAKLIEEEKDEDEQRGKKPK